MGTGTETETGTMPVASSRARRGWAQARELRADSLSATHTLTEKVPQGLLDKIAFGEDGLVPKDIVQVGGIIDDHARRQAGDVQLKGLVAEDALALDEPREELLPGLQEQDSVADKGQRVGRLPTVGDVSEGSTMERDERRMRAEVSPSYLNGAPPLVMPLFLKTDCRIKATTANPTAQVSNDIIAMQYSVRLSPSQREFSSVSAVWADQLKGRMGLDWPFEVGRHSVSVTHNTRAATAQVWAWSDVWQLPLSADGPCRPR